MTTQTSHQILPPERYAAIAAEYRYGNWLHARVHARLGLHRLLLAEHVPAMLESLPEGVDGWQFVRRTDREPYLRLSFRGDPAALRTRLPASLRSWSDAMVAGGLAVRLAVDARGRAGADPAPVPSTATAAEVMQADSEAVLAQLRLGRVRAFTIHPDVVCAAGMADLARAFCGADRADRVLDVSRLVDPDAARAPRLALLEPWWVRRAETLARYGSEMRDLAMRHGEPGLFGSVLHSLLRIHHHRVPGATARAFEILDEFFDIDIRT